MNIMSQLPYEIVMHILEYNPEHREKMRWVLHDIRNTQYCDVCNKLIIKCIYSLPRCDMICCSMKCVDYYYE